MSEPPFVHLRDVGIAYATEGLPAVEIAGVSLSVPAGGSAALVGPSGSGKSSILNVISGLVRPARGTVRVGDVDLRALNDDELSEFRRSNVGFVFQAFHLLPHLTAEENVRIGALVSGASPTEADVRAGDALAEVGLGHRRRHRPAQLSGGEQQRVALARVYAAQPRLVLADEPTGNLDPAATEVVLVTLRRLQSLLGATVVLATHSPLVATSTDVVVQLPTALGAASSASPIGASAGEPA